MSRIISESKVAERSRGRRKIDARWIVQQLIVPEGEEAFRDWVVSWNDESSRSFVAWRVESHSLRVRVCPLGHGILSRQPSCGAMAEGEAIIALQGVSGPS